MMNASGENDEFQKFYNQYRPKPRSPGSGTPSSSYYSTYSSNGHYDHPSDSEYSTSFNRLDQNLVYISNLGS